jgi:hypothetical protein|tara:strand:+ start:545 stop:754 length:210 start_codon:yes stop_codon:yes gene_type:complete
MDDQRYEELANLLDLAVHDYSRACEAFEVATKMYGASVMLFISAMNPGGDGQFYPPPSEPAPRAPDFLF